MRVEAVERIDAPDAATFLDRYVRRQRPVIVRNLFAGQPIDEIRAEADAVRVFGSIELPIQNEYLAALDESGPGASLPPPLAMTLAEYLDFIKRHPNTAKMCSEKPTPPDVMRAFTPPPWDSYEDAISSFFVGNAGNYARLHFDLDFRHVLLYQIFGSKRFLLIPPGAVEKLPAVGNYSWWSLENFSEEEKQRLIEFTGGYDCVLHAGETIYIPAAMWHFVEYVTTGMSFNLRFGRNPYTRFLGSALHPSVFAQNLAWALADERGMTDLHFAAFEELAAAYNTSYSGPAEKSEVMEEALRKACRKVCPGYPTRDHGVANWRKLSGIYANASEQFYQRMVPTPAVSSLDVTRSALATQ